MIQRWEKSRNTKTLKNTALWIFYENVFPSPDRQKKAKGFEMLFSLLQKMWREIQNIMQIFKGV